MRIDPVTALGIAITLGSALVAQNPQRQANTQIATATDASRVATRIETVAAESLATLAESRYQSGLCFVAQNPIAPGQEIKESVPPGSFACDAYGTTAAIAPSGELVKIARTGNQAIILQGIK